MQTDFDLKGRIISKYGTLDAFSKDVGWSNSKTSNLLRNKESLTLRDANVILNALGITDAALITSLFFCR